MKFSLIVINQNRADDLRRCLESVYRLEYRPVEVVIYDHRSTDCSHVVIEAFTKKARAAGMEVKLLATDRMGVSASRNFAAGHATGDALCFLDNDACFTDADALEKCGEIYKAHPRCAVISFRILKADTQGVDPSAWVFRRPDTEWAGRAFDTFTFTGGGFCIRADAYRDNGGFWEMLEYSREEEDLSLALMDRGWEILYSPAVTIRHYPGERGRDGMVRRRHAELMNGVLVLWRRFPLAFALPLITLRVTAMAVKSVTRDGIRPGDFIRALPDAFSKISSGLKREPISFGAAFRFLSMHRYS